MRYLLLATIFFLIACAGSKSSEIGVPRQASNELDEEEYSEILYDELPSKKGVSTSLMGGLMGGSAGGIGTRERIVNYRGSIDMQAPNPEAVIDTVIEQVRAKGGSVSNRMNGYVSLQIPLAEFKSFFNYILTLGNVTSKNFYAKDITDAYTDNANRIRITENALARLQELLALAKTEQEKVALLKEIQRLNEQIEQRKLEEKDLLRRAAFPTINLWVSNIPQSTVSINTNIKAFEWLDNIFAQTKNAFKLNIPKNFIETKNSKNEWRAASAQNSVFWTFEKKNNPKGSANFWANAMLEFFKSKFITELKTEENYSLIRLQNNFGEIYYIAILKSSNEKTLKIAQAYFPNKEAEEKDSEAIKEVLGRAK